MKNNTSPFFLAQVWHKEMDGKIDGLKMGFTYDDFFYFTPKNLCSLHFFIMHKRHREK
jgi:hypothetical protein